MPAKKILLVDDARTSLLIEKMVLRRTSYEVLTAGDGVEALQKAEAEQPDLILMDVVMPRMNGFEALKELRKREATKHIPVIMVTTRGEQGNVRTGFDCGCNDYVTKPIHAGELLSKIRGCLGD